MPLGWLVEASCPKVEMEKRGAHARTHFRPSFHLRDCGRGEKDASAAAAERSELKNCDKRKQQQKENGHWVWPIGAAVAAAAAAHLAT